MENAITIRQSKWLRQTDMTSCGLYILEWANSQICNALIDKIDPIATREKYHKMLKHWSYDIQLPDYEDISSDDDGNWQCEKFEEINTDAVECYDLGSISDSSLILDASDDLINEIHRLL